MASGIESIMNCGLVRNAREDPRKTAVLVILLVVMAMLWVKVLTASRTGPGAVVAATPQEMTGGATSDSALTAVGSGPAGQMQEWLRTPVRPIERNLFAVRLDYFPTESGRATRIESEPVEGFWEQLAKSTTAQADQRRERQILIENLKRQAEQLKLQTIVMGETPKAMINGEPVGEGGTVASFRVIRIEARRVLIEREGVRLELHMK